MSDAPHQPDPGDPPGSAFPTYPAAPSGPSGAGAPPPPPAEPERPTSIRAAVGLMYLGAVLSVLGGLLGFAMEDEIREQLQEQDTGAVDIDTLVQVTLVVGLVSAIVGAGLWVLNAVFCGKGHQWARILASTLFGISLLFTPVSFTQPAPALSRISAIVSLLVGAGAVALLWVSSSNEFFRKSAARRERRAL